MATKLRRDNGQFLDVEQIYDVVEAVTPGVTKYVAILTQTGTNAPVATVLENSLGGTVVWTRTGTGTYEGTLTTAFPVDKTHILVTADGFGSGIVMCGGRSADNKVIVSSNSLSAAVDMGGADFHITITVYP